MAIYHLSMKIISRKTATVLLLLLPTVPALSYPMTVPD
ncbi:mobA domain protein [Escherichia coli DEC10B]|nr:mobA domain protein [Escherichia coli DEC10B]